MAIQTERPGGGDDRIAIFRAKSADEARRARAALETAGIPVELPDQAIDAIYGNNPNAEMAVKVALKHSARAIKVISDAIPPPAPPSEIEQAPDRQAAAEQVLKPIEAPVPLRTDRLPPSAIDKDARRAAILALAATMFPPLGFIAAYMGWAAWSEMEARQEEAFMGKPNAKLGVGLGLLVGIVGTAGLVAILAKRMH